MELACVFVHFVQRGSLGAWRRSCWYFLENRTMFPNIPLKTFENSCCVCHVVLRGSGLELVCPRELTCFVRIPWKMSQEDLGYDNFIERERESQSTATLIL